MKIEVFTGRGIARAAVIGALAAVVLGAVFIAVRGDATASRGPIAVPNPAAESPRESVVGGVRRVANGAAPELLVADSLRPSGPARLLFFRGRPAQPTPAGDVLTLDAAGAVLRFDDRLQAGRISPPIAGRAVASVAGAADDGVWLVGGGGDVFRLDARGNVLAHQRGPFAPSAVASDADGIAWLVRSPERRAVGRAAGHLPLLVRLDAEGEPDLGVGNGVVAANAQLNHLANTGRIAVGDSAIYYAPFMRDEVVAISTVTGDTLWLSSRGLPQGIKPRYDVAGGQPPVDYAPVNLGVSLGPDERLYVLSVAGHRTDGARIDVLDPATGYLVRSTMLGDSLPTVAVDADGRLYVMDPFALLTGVRPGERRPFQAFDLETLDGGRYASASLAGKVVLVNFWASWCGPCRQEMPALDSLRRRIDDPDFRFITMNEDTDPADARAFMDENRFDFPVLLGRGRLRARYYYVGLPMTVLIDRDGKIVDRWMGYAGAQQIQMIRALILSELARGREDRSAGHHPETRHATAGTG